MRFTPILAGIAAGITLLLSGNELAVRLPDDLDYARGFFFIKGSAFPEMTDRNRIWLKRGEQGKFTGNTIDVFYRGGGKKFALELNGKKLGGRTGSKWTGVVRLRVPSGKHTIRIPDQREILAVCCKEVLEHSGVLISRPIQLPRGTAGVHAVVNGGKAKVVMEKGKAVIHVETKGEAVSELKLKWDGSGKARIEKRPETESEIQYALLDNMEKIFPEKIYRTGKAPLMLYGTPGEKVSFQIALRSSLPGEFVSVSGNIPCGKIESAYQYCVNVSSVRQDRFSNNRIGQLPRKIPDMLQPGTCGFLKKGETGAFWLTLQIDEKAEPGVHHGQLVIQTAQGRKTVPLQVKTLPFRLPRPQEYKFEVQHSAFFIRQLANDCGIVPDSPEFFQLFDAVLAMLKADGQNMLEFSWEYPAASAAYGKDGKWQFDFSNFNKYHGRILNAFRDYPHFRMVIPIAVPQVPWGIREPDVKMSFNNRKVRFPVWQDKNKCILSPEYKAFFKAFWPAFYKNAERFSARDKIWFRICDEPHASHIGRYRTVRDYFKSISPEFKVQEAIETAAVYRHLNNRIDMAIAHVYSVTNLEKILKKRSASGLATGIYSAMTGPAGSWINMNLSGIRVQPYVAYQLGAVMINNYGWYYNGGIDMREYPSKINDSNPGDYSKVYPIPEAKMFLPSLRTVSMRDARYDFALLQRLETANRKAMEKLGITDSDPAADGRTLCRLLGELPAIFNVSKENIKEIRKRVCLMIVERSSGIPAVIDSEFDEKTNIGTIRVRTIPKAKIKVNGQEISGGTAKVFLSPENNLVTVDINGHKFTKFFFIKSNQIDALKKLIHTLGQIMKVPEDLAGYPEQVQKSSALDYGKVLKRFPEVQKQLQEYYITKHLDLFFKGVVPADLKESVAQVKSLLNKGKRQEAIRLIDMMMRLEPSRLKKAASGAMICPVFRDNRFAWVVRNKNLTAVFHADTMRLVSLKRGNKEYCSAGMTELFDSDLMGKDAAEWELFPGEDSPEKVVLRGRRFTENLAIERQVILTSDCDILHFRTQIQAGNLPVWDMRWRTHGFYRGTHFGNKEISSCPTSQRLPVSSPFSLGNSDSKSVLWFIPRCGIQNFLVWHDKDNLLTIDFSAQQKINDAFGKVCSMEYDLYPGEEGENCPNNISVPGQRVIMVDFSKPLSYPHKVHGKVRFSSDGMILDGAGALELLPSKDFSLRYPFSITFDFTPDQKGGVLFKRSVSQGELYFYPGRRISLIMPSRRTSNPKYVRHIIPDKYKGRMQLTLTHDGEFLKVFMNNEQIGKPSAYPGTAGNGLPDGWFIGAYGVRGKRAPEKFFHGTIHSMKITSGSK